MLIVLAGTLDNSANRLIVNLRPSRNSRSRSLIRLVSWRNRVSATFTGEDVIGIPRP